MLGLRGTHPSSAPDRLTLPESERVVVVLLSQSRSATVLGDLVRAGCALGDSANPALYMQD